MQYFVKLTIEKLCFPIIQNSKNDSISVLNTVLLSNIVITGNSQISKNIAQSAVVSAEISKSIALCAVCVYTIKITRDSNILQNQWIKYTNSVLFTYFSKNFLQGDPYRTRAHVCGYKQIFQKIIPQAVCVHGVCERNTCLREKLRASCVPAFACVCPAFLWDSRLFGKSPRKT